MSNVEHSPPSPSGSPWRRWLPHVDWRPRLRWFAAEFLVVVVGILTALALNAWWQSRQDAAREKNYLALISRDLGQMGSELEELRAFEDDQIQNGLRAYRIVSASTHTPAEEQEVSRSISQLETRRTMAVIDAAYEDLTSTGNLWLIRDPKLRDRIVTFYEWAEREKTVHNRNNTFFVDELFVGRMFGQGLFLYRGNPPQIVLRSDSTLRGELAVGYIEQPDRIWGLPADAPEWAVARGQLLLRLDISDIALDRAQKLLAGVRELREAVDDARTR